MQILNMLLGDNEKNELEALLNKKEQLLKELNEVEEAIKIIKK